MTFGRMLVNARWYLLVIAIAFAGASWILKKDVAFDTTIEGMFAPGNQSLAEYQRLKDIFGGAEIVLAVYDDQDLLNPDGSGLTRLRARTAELRSVEGVIDVLSLAEINDALNAFYSAGKFPKSEDGQQAPLATPILNPDDKLAKEFLKTFQGYTHAVDGNTAAIVCLLERLETLKIPRATTIRVLRSVAHTWEGSRITGEPVLLADGFRFIRRDGSRLNQICLLLMGVVIIACFRSLRWMLIPVAVIKLSLWMTLATLAILGWKLTMVSSMLSAIVAVISVATIVHITVRYREARSKKGYSREDAMVVVIDTLVMPISWTCLTTAAGFFALTLAGVEPIRDFGWMMTFGSLFVLVNVLMLVPGLALIGTVDADPQETWGEGILERILRKSSLMISRFPARIGLFVTLLMASIGSGILFLEVETDFTKNFRQDSEIIQAYKFVEERMGGAGLLDVVIESPANLTKEFLDRIDKMQDKFRGLNLESEDGIEPALSHVVSFADANRILQSHHLLQYLPMNLRFPLMSSVMPGFAAQMKTTEPDKNGKHYFRIMLRTSQQKSATQQESLINQVSAIVNESFPPTDQTSTGPMTTGFFVLLSNIVSSVLADQLKTFLAACVFIGIVILIAFGSVRVVFIALLPNVLPIIGLLGMLGWLGIKLNMGAAMIAAVSLGLSIDGTIHYLTGYQINKKAGYRTSQAISRVQFRTGRALIYSTVALVIGFGSLCISEFIPTVFFGALVGLSMLGGMLGNLIVLPVLLTLLDKGGVGSRTCVEKSDSTKGAPGEPGQIPNWESQLESKPESKLESKLEPKLESELEPDLQGDADSRVDQSDSRGHGIRSKQKSNPIKTDDRN